MEPRISLITFGVEDLDRAVRFHRDGLALPPGCFRDPDGFLWEIAHNPHFWIE